MKVIYYKVTGGKSIELSFNHTSNDEKLSYSELRHELGIKHNVSSNRIKICNVMDGWIE